MTRSAPVAAVTVATTGRFTPAPSTLSSAPASPVEEVRHRGS
jgi:hypothetical protein